ncbi:DUF6216 family protein [Xanthomonas campestris]|uniref:DUF6216 family protein n=1 Tax=Xanthomonas campestris TaxID=339 RepID=UPI0011157F56|nr:DUF6216 family protein [Xanthomonas campestris]WVL61778.1 DUF6216 family protein [Xanthomonas campestris pv. barbareae]
MGTTASWNEIATVASAAFPVLGISIVAIYLCYKSGTLHPLRNRLMRLFISREDIEPGPIRDSLSDRSAVVSFGMIYGIHLDTPDEVEALITGARARNIPLHLIGHAGNAFDRQTLSMKAGKTPRRWLDALIIITIFSAYVCALTLAASIFTKDVLIRIKATDTVVWISTKDRKARHILSNDTYFFSAQTCASDSSKIESLPAPSDQRAHDTSVLCSIWRSPKAQAEIKNTLTLQRVASGSLALLCLALLITSARSLIRRKAIRRLEQIAPPPSSI